MVYSIQQVQGHIFLRSHAPGHKSKLGISLDCQLLFRDYEEECYLLQINDYDKFHVILQDAH